MRTTGTTGSWNPLSLETGFWVLGILIIPTIIWGLVTWITHDTSDNGTKSVVETTAPKEATVTTYTDFDSIARDTQGRIIHKTIENIVMKKGEERTWKVSGNLIAGTTNERGTIKKISKNKSVNYTIRAETYVVFDLYFVVKPGKEHMFGYSN